MKTTVAHYNDEKVKLNCQGDYFTDLVKKCLAEAKISSIDSSVPYRLRISAEDKVNIHMEVLLGKEVQYTGSFPLVEIRGYLKLEEGIERDLAIILCSVQCLNPVPNEINAHVKLFSKGSTMLRVMLS